MSISNPIGILNAYQNVSRLTPETQKNDTSNNPLNAIQSGQITVQNETQASLVMHLFGGTPAEQSQNGLKLTFQAAIDKLNEQFKAEFGDKYEEMEINQQNLDAKGMEYWTPENTAGRIVAGATNFLDGFQKVHPELEGEALMDKYMEVVGGGLQQGFGEARGILEDLKVFEDGVKDTFQQTFDLVNKGMENFRRDFLGLPPLEEEAKPATESAEESVTS